MWLKKHDCNDTLKIVHSLSSGCKRLGGPLTRQLCNLLSEERYLEVASFEFDYSWAFSISDFYYARQVQALVAKQDFLDFGIDRKYVALTKFLASEVQCKSTNDRFRDPSRYFDSDVSIVCHYAQRKIQKVLGPVPELDELNFSFGPGANTNVKSRISSARAKISAKPTCSTNMRPIIRRFINEFPHLKHFYLGYPPDFVGPIQGNHEVLDDCSRITFVPKTSKEDRTIAIEPTLNGLYQKGVGKFIAGRLRKFGVDLKDQTRNRLLAQKGSIDNSLLTLDLSAASDTISSSVVWELLPYDWASFLDVGRCATSSIVDENQKIHYITLEKFSSMGNAFTFELESLIFYALTDAVCEYLDLDRELISVYGDDIIAPVGADFLLRKVLDFFGFQTNAKKSFSEGPFRESCGGDYLYGIDIRPFYLKELLDESSLYVMHNFFVRRGDTLLASIVLKYIRRDMALFGPDGYGDGHLLGDHTLRSNRKMKRDGFCGGVFDTYRCGKASFKKPYKGDYIYPLYSTYITTVDPLFGDPTSDSSMYSIRGVIGFDKISIYTLHTTEVSYPSIFKKCMGANTARGKTHDVKNPESDMLCVSNIENIIKEKLQLMNQYSRKRKMEQQKEERPEDDAP